MEELWVEVTDTFEEEFAKRIIAFLKNEKRQKSLLTRFARWVSSVTKLHCTCRATGSGCGCEREQEGPSLPVVDLYGRRLPVADARRLPVVVPGDTPPPVLRRAPSFKITHV